MSIITLTTDYGLKDHFVGALKGKLLSENPNVTIVDISHDIDPFNTFEASYCIAAAYSSFPEATIHIIGVDIESNKETCLLAMKWKNHYFIAADNGILSMLIERKKPEEIVKIDFLGASQDKINDIDVIIKAAIRLSNGDLLSSLGSEIDKIKPVSELKPNVSEDRIYLRGFVINIDHYGNIITNITENIFQEVGQGRTFEIILNEKLKQNKKSNIKSIGSRYSDIGKNSNYDLKNYEGEKLALFNEAGFLEIAIFRSNEATVGSASTLLGLNYRDVITIQFSEK